MKVTDIKVRKLVGEGRMRAVLSVTFDNEIVVHDIKVIEGPTRLFLAMPSYKMPDGSFRDIIHPINAEARQTLEETILGGIKNVLDEWLLCDPESASDTRIDA